MLLRPCRFPALLMAAAAFTGAGLTTTPAQAQWHCSATAERSTTPPRGNPLAPPPAPIAIEECREVVGLDRSGNSGLYLGCDPDGALYAMVRYSGFETAAPLLRVQYTVDGQVGFAGRWTSIPEFQTVTVISRSDLVVREMSRRVVEGNRLSFAIELLPELAFSLSGAADPVGSVIENCANPLDATIPTPEDALPEQPAPTPEPLPALPDRGLPTDAILRGDSPPPMESDPAGDESAPDAMADDNGTDGNGAEGDAVTGADTGAADDAPAAIPAPPDAPDVAAPAAPREVEGAQPPAE